MSSKSQWPTSDLLFIFHSRRWELLAASKHIPSQPRAHTERELRLLVQKLMNSNEQKVKEIARAWCRHVFFYIASWQSIRRGKIGNFVRFSATELVESWKKNVHRDEFHESGELVDVGIKNELDNVIIALCVKAELSVALLFIWWKLLRLLWSCTRVHHTPFSTTLVL